MSILLCPQELGLSYGILWQIYHLNLQLHPYKVQLTQQLKPVDHSIRRKYMEWVLEQQAIVSGKFLNKIFFSNEVHFTLTGYIIKKNCRIWGSEDPQVIKERPLHPEKVSVWCSL